VLPTDPVGVASALESLADVALYEGDLATSERFAVALRRHGEETDDGYALAAGLCGRSLALAYGGRVDAALAELGGADIEADERVPPSGRAWLAYAAGEAHALTDPEAAIAHFEAALDLAAGVSNHFIRTVTATSLLSARSRADDPAAALPAFDAVLRDFRRYGCRSHSTTALRNLVDVLARAGHDEPSMVLLGSLEGSAKTTYGTELERLEAARDAVTGRAGHARVAEWLAAGAARSHDPSAPVDLALAHLAHVAGQVAG
jgi:tetratricopeptide (TPR) repeat protein